MGVTSRSKYTTVAPAQPPDCQVRRLISAIRGVVDDFTPTDKEAPFRDNGIYGSSACKYLSSTQVRQKGAIVGQSVTITTTDFFGKLDNLTTFLIAIAYRRAITSKNRNFEVETESVSQLDLNFVLLKDGSPDWTLSSRIE